MKLAFKKEVCYNRGVVVFAQMREHMTSVALSHSVLNAPRFGARFCSGQSGKSEQKKRVKEQKKQREQGIQEEMQQRIQPNMHYMLPTHIQTKIQNTVFSYSTAFS